LRAEYRRFFQAIELDELVPIAFAGVVQYPEAQEQASMPIRGFATMIPDFNDDGYLPPGIHIASLEEIALRFGQEPELRQVQTESLRWLVDLARRVGVRRLVIDGSYVTDKWEPNDVDCILLASHDFPKDRTAELDLWDGLPFVQLAIVDDVLFDRYVQVIFGTDRKLIPKGMIEVIL
jgi:hypothetical protein